MTGRQEEVKRKAENKNLEKERELKITHQKT
jgi:hypothetical protein